MSIVKKRSEFRFYIVSLITFIIAAPALQANQTSPFPDVVEKVQKLVNQRLHRTGQDQTRPVTRFDFRYQYGNMSHGSDADTITYRAEKTRTFSQKWQIAERIDLPTSFNNSVSSDNPKGVWTFGMGDLLTQSILVYSITKSQAIGTGARFIFPTATQDQFGTGKYQFVPIGTYRIDTDWLRKGAYFNPTVRYAFDIGGRKDRRHISQLQMGPLVEIPITRGVFVDIFSSADICYNFETHEWFVPANFMVGKLWGKKVITSVEFWFPVIKDYRYYDFKMEARIGYFF
jgi:hypothetical protein